MLAHGLASCAGQDCATIGRDITPVKFHVQVGTFDGLCCQARRLVYTPGNQRRFMSIVVGIAVGLAAWFLMRYLAAGIYTVNQSERAVKTRFGRAERVGNATTLQDPIAAHLRPEERDRYCYPQVRVIPPGGPYFKWPWEKVHKVSVATQTINMACDPETPSANQDGTILDAVTKDQLNTGLTGQIRYRVSEKNLYAYLFGVKRPIVHVMGYFISVLRERIANFEAPRPPALAPAAGGIPTPEIATAAMGVSINDLRKNLRDINEHMDLECKSSEARYGIALEASLITGIDPPRRSSRPWRPSTRPTTRFPRTSAWPRPRPIRRSCNPGRRSRSRRSRRRPRSSRSRRWRASWACSSRAGPKPSRRTCATCA